MEALQQATSVNDTPASEVEAPQVSYTHEELSLDVLQVDTTYQRQLDTPRVNRIVKDWDINRAADPLVSRREDGSLWVFDGQHTVVAAKKKGLKTLRCRVYVGLTANDEAIRFATQDDGKRKVAKPDTYRALLNAKAEREVNIEKTLNKFNCSALKRKDERKGMNEAKAITAVEKIYDSLGMPGLEKILTVISNSWKTNHPQAFEPKVMMALWKVVNDNPQIDIARLAMVLKDHHPEHVSVEGSKKTRKNASRHGYFGIAEWIVGQYNRAHEDLDLDRLSGSDNKYARIS